MTYNRILIPLDDTELSARSLDVALHMATSFDAELILLRIHDQPAALEAGLAEQELNVIEEETSKMIDWAHGRARELGLKLGTVLAEVRAGAIVEAIVDAAEETMADLIVMGTHGRKGFGGAITGSRTERVVARTSASVFAVKPVGFPYLRDEEQAVSVR